MGQILRRHEGPVKVDADLLTDLDWLLDMDTAAPRSVVAPLADRLRAYDRDLALDEDIDCTEGIHDYLRVLEVDAMQRLRNWHRLRYGTLTVESRWLAEVRNVLDGLVLSWGTECEEYAAAFDFDPVQHAGMQAAIEQGRTCDLCVWCGFLIMRDRIDTLLDAQGFVGGPYYEAPTYDAEATWRQRQAAEVMAVFDNHGGNHA